ncbi:O-6-methylguanine DNA methyltransferase [Shewanella psychrophila]|uniref:Methylated-DNA--protein-cysteine methyltransferase n=1 Tax=Shewanella psychrophila TaxID=225848 RepID=A0A1S6HTA1_9GAMM|nr:O-6-methylguanine DNA methyltransferase [Shewanella psychrophila]
MKQLTDAPVFAYVDKEWPISAETIMAKTVTTQVGEIYIRANQFGLSHLSLVNAKLETSELTELNQQAFIYLTQAECELKEYFAGQRQHFSVSLAPTGTEFQREVWQALLALDYGCTCSYADIANKINRPKAVRAVGAANGANSIAIIIPCHRVIGKNGSLTGYAYGLEMKKSLLKLESYQAFSSFND